MDGDYRDQVATASFARALATGDVSLVLYDVTTLYFEAEKEDTLRKVGFSKKRRVDPQVVVRLLVDRREFPLDNQRLWNESESAGVRHVVPPRHQERRSLFCGSIDRHGTHGRTFDQ